MKKLHKILVLVLALCMTVSAVPAMALTPPITINFDSLDEVRRFFDLDEGLMVDGELKNITDYAPWGQTERISKIADTLVFPYLEVDGKTVDFAADWIPDRRSLEIVYAVDEVQYRFIYYFLSEKDWNYEDGTVKGVQMGPYQLSFRRTDHPAFAYSYVSGFREETTYVQVIVRSNREDCLNYERFQFVHLSDFEDEKQEPEHDYWLLVAGAVPVTAVTAGVIVFFIVRKKKAQKNEQTSDE